MRRLKIAVPATVFLLLFISSSSADIAAMSLQERMRRSDAVVVGTIGEVRQTDAGVAGQFPPPVTHWLATCRIERYIIGPKINNPAVEEGKAVSLIHIAFDQDMTSDLVDLKLVKGKRYLFFLKETGPNEYEMITPYHGAFEAEQDYFIHDEQSREYPQAVKMSFAEIVRRLTPRNPASVDIHQQPERELSEDELRMKECLTALNRGEGDVADLKIELMDGGMAKHRSDTIANGKIVSEVWDLTASPKHDERTVTDEEIRRLLNALIEHRYWTFKGTQFIPDAPGFMFRFHYKDLSLVTYRCEADEYEASAQLSAIRSVWLSFVSDAPSEAPVLSQSAEGVRK